MINFVDPMLAAALGLVAGLAIGLLVGLLRPPSRGVVVPPADEPVPPDVSQLIPLLDAAVLWVGRHDEVFDASPRAVSLGLARGSRVAHAPLLEGLREVRRLQTAERINLSLQRGLGIAVELDADIVPVEAEQILVVATDHTTEERINLAVRDFVANISHELKTPIGAVSLLAEAVTDGADDPEMVVRFAGRIGKETQRLNDLVSQLIALSRLQSEDPMLKSGRVQVSEVVNEAVDRCRPLAESRDVVLAIAETPDLTVLGDAEQLVTALLNLVQNAIVYSADKARVTVSTRCGTRDGVPVVEVAVTDNGSGISEDDQERVFERFYRADYARSRDNGGTGLGLPIVRHVAQAHGGDVALWSRPGQGSTFTIHIPREGTS